MDRKAERVKQGDLPDSEEGVHGPQGPEEPPAGVRAPVVARKGVTNPERRGAGRWRRDG